MVRGDCKAGQDTRLLFCTYGVLLRRMQEDDTLAAIDYIGAGACMGFKNSYVCITFV